MTALAILAGLIFLYSLLSHRLDRRIITGPMFLIALARVDQPLTDRSRIVYLLQEVGLGILLGMFFGWIGGWSMGHASKRHWMSDAMQQLALLALAILSWVVFDFSPGNSFIGVFLAGLMIKNGFESAGEQMVEFSEGWG